jgi:spermidine dehydrogenase
MHRNITRRDLLQGVGAVSATSFIPGRVFAEAMLAAEDRGNYPPALTGMRGNHPGSFDVAHKLAREGVTNWGSFSAADSGEYDLIVVGAGISGLAAAHFYRKSHPDARILILDNHDDFGGHARRNEFDVDGKMLIGYGGAQTLEEPYDYNAPSKQLLRDLGIDLSRFETAYDYEFYKRNGLRAVVHFDEANWGVNRLVDCDLGALRNYVPLAPATTSIEDAVEQMPMSSAAREQMLHLLTTTENQLSDMTLEERLDYIYSISYQEFLEKHLGITEPEVLAAMQRLATDTSLGIDHASAIDSLLYVALPGVDAAGVRGQEGYEPYIHHFPDGNASIARLLVRSMIPGVAPGTTMEDVVTAPFDYEKLDTDKTAVRLRLNSTVVQVENEGPAASSTRVSIGYVRDGKSFRVSGKHCVLACYNAMIPSICPELPAKQREALAWQVKTPMLYTSVALRNWRAWEKLGVGGIVSPSGYHTNAMLDFPVSMGDYKFSQGPDEPIMVHMERFFYLANQGLTTKEQLRAGRLELYGTSFETIERNVRQQLADMLAGGGFDPAEDIAAITVNRWAHGYAYGYSGVDGDPRYDDPDDPRYPHVQARQSYGRITIANSDAGAGAVIHRAIGQAHRAVQELDQA